MSNNAKNKLQEYCVANGLKLPLYDTKKIDNQLFKSYISLSDIKCSGGEKGRKSSAEIDAAEVMLNIINLRDEKTKITYKGNLIGIFIDHENKPLIYEELEKKINIKNSFIYINIFSSSKHILVNKIKTYSYCIKHLIDSTDKDAADIYLIYDLIKNVDLYDTVIIVSDDHFAIPLAHIINNYENINTYICKNTDQIIDIINKNNLKIK